MPCVCGVRVCLGGGVCARRECVWCVCVRMSVWCLSVCSVCKPCVCGGVCKLHVCVVGVCKPCVCVVCVCVGRGCAGRVVFACV